MLPTELWLMVGGRNDNFFFVLFFCCFVQDSARGMKRPKWSRFWCCLCELLVFTTQPDQSRRQPVKRRKLPKTHTHTHAHTQQNCAYAQTKS